MVSKVCSIEFSGIYEGREHHVSSYKNEYRNLMVLLKDKIWPEDFGQCGGMGRCGTCLVKIPGLSSHADDSCTNERNTLLKMGVVDPTTRLSCQILIDEDLQNAEIELIDNI